LIKKGSGGNKEARRQIEKRIMDARAQRTSEKRSGESNEALPKPLLWGSAGQTDRDVHPIRDLLPSGLAGDLLTRSGITKVRSNGKRSGLYARKEAQRGKYGKESDILKETGRRRSSDGRKTLKRNQVRRKKD